MTLKTLGKKLKSNRVALGLSRSAVAKSIRTSNQTIARIEAGQHDMHLSVFRRICKFYNVSPHKMLK